MTATILSFAEAKLRKRIQRELHSRVVPVSKGRHSASNTTSYFVQYNHQTEEEYFEEYAEFLQGFNSSQTKYKHPTVLSDYRKNINPVCALYENLQESLFKYNPDNEFCTWTIDLFRDDVWVAKLIADLTEDCNRITAFQEQHFGTDHKLESLYVLQNIKNNFQNYIYVFNMMQEWEH